MSKAKQSLQLIESMYGAIAAGIMFKHQNEVFLAKPKGEQWQVPSTMKEDKELDTKDCAIRGFRNCTGMLPGYADTGKMHSFEDDDNKLNLTYLYESDMKFDPGAIEKEDAQDANDEAKYAWIDVNSLPKDLHPATDAALDAFGLKEYKAPEKPMGWK